MNTFSGLSLEIGYPPVQTPLTLGPGFGYGSGSPEAGNYTQVSGWFTSNTMANGTVVFGGIRAAGTPSESGRPPGIELDETIGGFAS